MTVFHESVPAVLTSLDRLLPELEALYEDLQAHPELSMRVHRTGPAPASEDFGCFGAEWRAPSVFWFGGGNEPEAYEKGPRLAAVLHPTLQTGVEAMVVGALAGLSV